MSSSTVSITPNTTGATLRRSTDKKPGQDPTNSDGIDTSLKNDLSHSIKDGAETVSERSKPVATTKLRKKSVAKKTGGDVKAKAPWKTAVSVIVKNLGLLVILLLLVQMVRKLGFNHGGGVGFEVAGVDYERRIAEVEAFLKTTTKMMQVQVEVVDKKLESEVSGLRSELGKRMDDESGKFNKRFNEMDVKIGSLEGVLNGNEWLTREEFDKFVEEFKGRKGGEMGLDEIRAFAKGVVEKEIGKHAADGLGRVDYAVASGGASVVKHSEAYVGGSGANRVTEWLKGGSVRGDSVKVLQPSFGQPGECFPLKGESGFVEIKLRTAIVPEAITLEHVDKSVAFDRSSAPKDCKVLGWLRNEEDTEKEHLLAEFTYDLEKSSAQTFNVLDSKSSDPTIIDTLRLEFMSNHGSPTHTCIYRVRVHGHQPSAS
uniref:Protein SAD1/UNC-84 domain protein 1-like n=1 Tax=Tanacetum cinerariifolium TaxID=118510 RepID=A0A6L2MQ19_TANCI|nr:protein SAD1/UNC-84 domain protein 1-like [Tanacetum cinerariifolium]